MKYLYGKILLLLTAFTQMNKIYERRYVIQHYYRLIMTDFPKYLKSFLDVDTCKFIYIDARGFFSCVSVLPGIINILVPG